MRGGRLRSALLPLLPLLSLLPSPANAQPRLVQLVNADSVLVDATSGETVRRLIGSVVLRQDTTTLSAARTVQYVERGELVMEGAVRIVTGRDTLTADRVVYDANTNEATASGDVRIANGETVILAPSARHNRLTEVSTFDRGGRLLQDDAALSAPRGVYDALADEAVFEGGVELRDSTTVLTSQTGRYDTARERADFAGEVRLRQPGVRLEADSLTHFRPSDRSEARGHVVLERLGGLRDEAEEGAQPDSTERLLLFGARAEHDEQAGTSRVVGSPARDPLLVQLRRDSLGATDTTLVRARRLDAFRGDRLAGDSLGGAGLFTRLVGVGDVRLVRDRLAAHADSAAFERLEPRDSLRTVSDRLALHGSRPSVWFEAAQVTGDTLVAHGRAEAIERLDVTGEAFAAQLDSVLGRVRQLAGRRMQVLFEGDSLRLLAVWPNAEAIYFRASPDSLLAGAERLSADSLAFVFAGGALSEIRGERGIEGVSYGPQIIPEPFALPGYVYTPEARPLRPLLLDPEGWEATWLAADAAPPPLPPPSGGVP